SNTDCRAKARPTALLHQRISIFLRPHSVSLLSLVYKLSVFTTVLRTMRVFTFSPGPAVLPLEVLEQAREELLDWHGSGMSVLEMNHRGNALFSMGDQVEAD